MNIILLSILLMVALVLIIPNVYADSTPIRANINIQYIDPLYPGDRVSFNFITTSQPQFDFVVNYGDGSDLFTASYTPSQGSSSISRVYTYDEPGEYIITQTVSYRADHPHTETYTDTQTITVLAPLKNILDFPPGLQTIQFNENDGFKPTCEAGNGFRTKVVTSITSDLRFEIQTVKEISNIGGITFAFKKSGSDLNILKVPTVISNGIYKASISLEEFNSASVGSTLLLRFLQTSDMIKTSNIYSTDESGENLFFYSGGKIKGIPTQVQLPSAAGDVSFTKSIMRNIWIPDDDVIELSEDVLCKRGQARGVTDTDGFRDTAKIIPSLVHLNPLDYLPTFSPAPIEFIGIPSGAVRHEISDISISVIIDHDDGSVLFQPETVAVSSGDITIELNDISENISAPNALPDRSTIKVLLEFGDESKSVTFTKPVKITLNAQSGNIPFWYAPLQGITDHQPIIHCSTSNFDFRDIELFGVNECYYEENGNIVIWTNHFTTFGTFSENASIQKKSGGGSNDWMKKPTFGKSFENTNAQLVSDGFIFNGYTLNIIDNWHTDFIKTSSIIGETNHVEMKVYTDKTLSTMTLSLGIPEVGKKSDAETAIYVTLNRDYDNPNGYDIIDITHEQKENLIDEEQTKASIHRTSCSSGDNVQRCHTLLLDFVVMAPLSSDVLAISAMDTQRRSTTTFVNEGVEFIGTPLLDPHTYNINQKHGSQNPMEILLLTQQDRRYNIWEDNNGYLWERNDYGSYKQITFAEFERNQDKYNSVMTRLHSEFAQLVIAEQNKAVLIFDSTTIVSDLGESFVYDYHPPMDKLLDPFVIENMKLEEQKAMDRYHILPQYYQIGYE